MYREKRLAAMLLPDATEEAAMPKDWRLTGDQPWQDFKKIPTHDYECGYCGAYVSSENGLITGGNRASSQSCLESKG